MFNLLTNLLPAKTWFIIIGVSLLMATGYFLYKQHVNLVAENAELMRAVEERDAIIVLQAATIEQMQKDFEQQKGIIRELNDKNKVYQVQKRELEDKLAKHDIGYLALHHPLLIEKAFNKGIKDRNRCLEVASGDEVLDSERGLSRSERNNVCPSLFGYTD